MLNTLAQFIADTRYTQLPDTLIAQAKRHFLDTLGASLAGSDSPVWRECLSLAISEGGLSQSQVWGSDRQMTARQAAWLNGIAAHMYELDDTGGCDHSGAVVIPAILAVLPLVAGPVSGQELITAMVIGYDIGRRVLEACGGYSAHNGAGWHSTATCGVFGAAAAACSLLKLDASQCASALGIAGSFSGGVWGFIHDGSQTKKLHAARAAESGVQAAQLAQRGISGPSAVFDACWGGFLETIAPQTQQPQALTEDLGVVWKLARCSVKPYASCRGTHSAVDALDSLLHQHKTAPADIDRIIVGVNPFLRDMTGTRDVASLAAAQMSLPYALTARALYGSADLAVYEDDKRLNPEAEAFMARVILEIDPLQGQDDEPWVRLETRQGEQWQCHVPIASGAPSNPLSHEALTAKFRSLAGRALPQSQVAALESLCFGLDQLADAQEINRLLAR